MVSRLMPRSRAAADAWANGTNIVGAAATADELGDTIDYYAVTQRLLRFGDGVHWKLIETLAVDVAQMILEEFGPPSVTVEVKKFIIPEARHVSVRVTRTRSH